MKEIDTKIGEGDTKILLIRIDGRYVAVGNKCPHYGAPLSQGLLSGHRVVCPWHNASFCVNSGRAIDAPSLDGLPKYEVEVVKGRVLVRIPKEGVGNKNAARAFVRRDPNDKRTFVVVGSGPAGMTAAETLRESGFKGRVIVITRESCLPYDRTQLSKNIGIPLEKTTIRNDAFYAERDIEFLFAKNVVSLDSRAKTITLHDNTTINYDSALVASGARARFPAIPGSELRNIFVLRSSTDSLAIKEAADKAKRAVVIGSSFIGVEAASSLVKTLKMTDVTIVGMEAVPLERILGHVVGQSIMKNIVESLGIKFRLQRAVTRFEGSNGQVTRVILDNGEKVDCDLVIVGAGVVPETSFVHGVRKNIDGGIVVDSFFRANKDLYVAGDIASFPFWLTNERVRIEHWNVAIQQARIAARNMAGRPCQYQSIPFFWSVLGKQKLNFVGVVDKYDDVVYEGEVDQLKFIAYYLKEGNVVACAAMNMPNAGPALAEALRTGKMPTGEELRGGRANMKTILEDIKPKGGECNNPSCPKVM